MGRKLTTLRAHYIRIVGVVGSNPIRSTKMEIAVVFTTAISRLTTEIPQTDFCFDHLKGTPFSEGVPFIVYCGAKSEVVFSCFTFAMLDFPRP